MILRKSYSLEKFDKITGLKCNPFGTYIINGFVYSGGYNGSYTRFNRKALDYEGIKKIQDLGEAHEHEVVIIFKGGNHTTRAAAYLQTIKTPL